MTAAAQQPPLTFSQWESRILQERQAAMELMRGGQLTEACTLVAQTLRNLPPEHPKLADTAVGSLQWMLFVMEYLMDDQTLTSFLNTLDPQHDVDRLISLMFSLYVGLESERKTPAVVEITYLTASDMPFVRVVSLFALTIPYVFFDNDDFRLQRCEILLREYPDFVITQESLRLNVYGRIGETLEDAKNAVTVFKSDKQKDDSPLTWQEPVQEAFESDSFISEITTIAEEAAGDTERAVEELLERSETAPDFRDRYGYMLLAERYSRSGFAGEVHEKASKAVRTKSGDTIQPDALRTRVIACKLAAASLVTPAPEEAKTKNALKEAVSPEHVVALASDLLAARWTETVLERNLYEEQMRTVQNAAKGLAEAGYEGQAEQLFQALSTAYPNSMAAPSGSNE